MSKKVLITGGAGYIGSHTIIELLNQTDFEVISVDNFSNSYENTYSRIEQVTGKKITSYPIDLCDKKEVQRLFNEQKDICGIIHFAAFKLVPESIAYPLKYYTNNLYSLLNLLETAKENGVSNFIFSSSCSVYGNQSEMPVNENTPLGKAESPYAYTKQIGERILEDFCKIEANFKCIALRYFNPAGAHQSGLIGEDPVTPPTSLAQVITKTAAGIIPKMEVHGTDYDTRDGSCIRDYIHVSDVAEAHISALNLLLNQKSEHRFEIINIGTGTGITVLEAIRAFEKVSATKLTYEIGPRRPGDVVSIYSDNTLAEKRLKWKPKHTIESMMASAWKWEQNLMKKQP